MNWSALLLYYPFLLNWKARRAVVSAFHALKRRLSPLQCVPMPNKSQLRQSGRVARAKRIIATRISMPFYMPLRWGFAIIIGKQAFSGKSFSPSPADRTALSAFLQPFRRRVCLQKTVAPMTTPLLFRPFTCPTGHSAVQPDTMPHALWQKNCIFHFVLLPSMKKWILLFQKPWKSWSLKRRYAPSPGRTCRHAYAATSC